MPGGKPGYSRSVRLRELFIQEISKVLHELKDPGISGMVTITDLDLSPDRKSAKVYYSLLGNARDRESTQKALERSVGYLQRQALGKLRIRVTPRLSFVLDDTPIQAQKIENVLNRIRSEETNTPLPEPPKEDELNALASAKKKKKQKPYARRRRRIR